MLLFCVLIPLDEEPFFILSPEIITFIREASIHLLLLQKKQVDLLDKYNPLAPQVLAEWERSISRHQLEAREGLKARVVRDGG